MTPTPTQAAEARRAEIAAALEYLKLLAGCVDDFDFPQLTRTIDTFTRLEEELSRLTSALAAREGYVLVPVEPTVEMVEAGRAQLSQGDAKVQTHARVMWVWEAMVNVALAARPTPADSGEEK